MLNIFLLHYRLNGFGFLVLNVLENRTGNYGILDQIEALRWIKKNIASFGGDPDKVGFVLSTIRIGVILT